MTELVVGNDDCPYTKVVEALLSPETRVKVTDEWRMLAKELNVVPFTIKKFESKTMVDILHDILADWRVRIGSKAKMETLVSCVTKIGWQSAAENLNDFIKMKQPNIFQVNETLPSPISYYIPRRLTTRSLLKREIFNVTSNDIFIYYGKIERYQVTQLANGNTTDTSRNQVFQPKLYVKHILLTQFGDWERLCKKALNNIHLINCHFDEDKFRWIESKGDVGLLQRFVAEKQDEYSEDKFQEFMVEEAVFPLRRNLPIIIADCPGMGKSVLLSQIGRSLKDANLQIIFIVTGDFVHDVQKRLNSRPTETLSALLASLAKYFCEPNYALHSLQMMTSSENHDTNTRLELMFDGFDEINEIDLNLAYECLSVLSQFKKNIRVRVTAGQHLLEKLEYLMGVPGYNIIPFTIAEQERYLEKVWSQRQEGDLHLDNLKLQSFIKECLSKVNSLPQSTENNYIAGVPLQCMLLAEAFQPEALQFATLKNESIDFHNKLHQIEINNIMELYERLVSNRFQKYFQTFGVSAEETPRLKLIHVYFAIKLIFPQWHALLEHLWRNMENPSELFKIGILEASSETEQPRFIHRTVAEYFVSWFITDQLSSIARFNPMLKQLKDFIPMDLLSLVMLDLNNQHPFSRSIRRMDSHCLSHYT